MKKQMLITLLLLVNGAVSTSIVQAAVRLTTPDENPGIPIYARTDLLPLLPDATEWAPITFYREPRCVPTDFNLLELIDVPRVWDCESTVAGFAIWADVPGLGAQPTFSQVHGLGAVPIWFVPWSELQTEMADGVLTILELESMPSLLKGSASLFEEAVGLTGTAQHPNFHAIAKGQLQDGRTFQYEAIVTEQDHPQFVGDRVVTLRIQFK